ncbi:MAG: MgtC/SapB family protein [Candidatus Pacearchaeota archaeon]
MAVETSEIFLRFGITFVFVLIFGLERQRAHNPVGFGTFNFVSLGACSLGITAVAINMADPFGLLAAIVTGIGFLGAGALIKSNDRVFGFTTAVSIWIFAIFGLTIGIGDYLIAGVLYTGVWMILGIDRILEAKGIGTYQKKIIIVTNKIIDEKEIRKNFDVSKCKVDNLVIDKKNNKLIVTYIVQGSREEILPIPSNLYSKPWFDSMKIN